MGQIKPSSVLGVEDTPLSSKTPSLGKERLQWVRPPVQERSQKTMERLLAAAEARIVEVGFDKATIADIAKRADSSVGAFYARFADKDALLRCLLDRFVFEAKATMDAAMQPELWAEASVQDLCVSLLSFLSNVLQQRRLFVLAISKATMDDAGLAEYRDALSMHAATGLERLIRARDVEVATTNLGKAMRVVTWMCLSVLEAGCMQPGEMVGGVAREELVLELSKMIVVYLDLE